MKTRPAPVPRFAAQLRPAATAMVWFERARGHEPMAVLDAVLAAGDVLVEIELSTVCDADLEIVRGDRPTATPLVLGHEGVGRVVTAGCEAVDADGAPLRPGDRAVWSAAIPCGACSTCLRGRGSHCPFARAYGHERVQGGWELSGAFATHIQLLAGTVVVKTDAAVPAGLLAPLSCDVATGRAGMPGGEHADDLRDAVRLVERAWRGIPPPALTVLPLSRLDEALALAAAGGRLGIDPRGEGHKVESGVPACDEAPGAET